MANLVAGGVVTEFRRRLDIPEYWVWATMIARCNNPNHNKYHRYGGRGITVCDRWLNSFEAFYEDMGSRPSPEHSIERKNNDVGYLKDNCRWATRIEQARNRSNNHFVVFEGREMTIAELSEVTGVRWSSFVKGLKTGKTVEKIIEEYNPRCLYTFNNRSMDLGQWSRELGINRDTLFHRVVTKKMAA